MLSPEDIAIFQKDKVCSLLYKLNHMPIKAGSCEETMYFRRRPQKIIAMG